MPGGVRFPAIKRVNAWEDVGGVLNEPMVPPPQILVQFIRHGQSLIAPLCRLYFDNEPKEIGLLEGNRTETRQPIQEFSNIYRFSVELKAIAAHYLNKAVSNGNQAVETETPGE